MPIEGIFDLGLRSRTAVAALRALFTIFRTAENQDSLAESNATMPEIEILFYELISTYLLGKDYHTVYWYIKALSILTIWCYKFRQAVYRLLQNLDLSALL